MWAKVIVPDIPASNGIIHIINNLVYYPYKTVAEMLDSTDELRYVYATVLSLSYITWIISSSDHLGILGLESWILSYSKQILFK